MNRAGLLICVTLLLAALACATPSCFGAQANAESFSGKVVVVIDGDTLLVLRDGQPVKVRLAEIDAPEKDQAFGMAAKESLAAMVKGKVVQVDVHAIDDYGRLVGEVRIGGTDVNREQVRRGMAWEYSRFHSNKELLALQHEAQQARRGLWAGEGAIEPSLWRKQHPSSGHTLATSSTVSPAAGSGCGHKKHCSEMSSCEEAMYYFRQCGLKELDGDNDGVPCENLCAPKSKAD